MVELSALGLSNVVDVVLEVNGEGGLRTGGKERAPLRDDEPLDFSTDESQEGGVWLDGGGVMATPEEVGSVNWAAPIVTELADLPSVVSRVTAGVGAV